MTTSKRYRNPILDDPSQSWTDIPPTICDICNEEIYRYDGTCMKCLSDSVKNLIKENNEILDIIKNDNT